MNSRLTSPTAGQFNSVLKSPVCRPQSINPAEIAAILLGRHPGGLVPTTEDAKPKQIIEVSRRTDSTKGNGRFPLAL
jgi:hypothetical protein